jgi:sugar/nucleoside kinase (ribokinase family)
LPEVLEHLLSADLEMLTLSRFVYVDLYEIIRKASVRAVQRASQCTVPLFINLGGDHLQEQDIILLRNAHVAVLQTSLDESSQRRPEDYAKELQDLIQPEVTIVTLAQRGLICVTASAIMNIPAYSVHTIHSSGAGAAFSAGFAYAYLQRWHIEKSLHFASALGGLFCTVKDGFGRFTPEYILDFVEKQEHK